MLMIACAAIYNAGVRAKIDAIVMKHRIVFCVDCFLAWLSLMALTICPVEKLTIVTLIFGTQVSVSGTIKLLIIREILCSVVGR